jgi:abhydrolase domain-containing protein 13
MDVSVKTSSSVISWVFFGGKVVGGLIIALTALLYANQERLLYHPNPPNIPQKPEDNPFGHSSPSDWTKRGQVRYGSRAKEAPIPFEDIMVSTPDGEKLHTWLLLQDDAENCPTIIYFHGNAANMGFRLQNAAEMYSNGKVNILMMDYRGYGRSSGHPNEYGLKIDGETVLQYASQHPK